MEGYFDEKTCHCCHKEFVVPDTGSWIYKRREYKGKKGKDGQNLRYFCSWACLRAWEKERS